MGLIEREHELALLGRLYEDCSEGRGRIVLISGAVATGKTELLETFSGHLRRQGAVVLKAAASRVETELPLGAVSQLVAAAEAVTADAPRPGELPGLAELATPWDTLDFDMSGRRELAFLRDLQTMLTAIARRAPVVVCVDDANYADAPSLLCLLYLARRLRSARVLLVLSDAESSRSGYKCFQADILREPGSVHIRLDLLSVHGTAQLLADRLDVPPDQDMVLKAHRLSGGNPLLLGSLVEDLRLRPQMRRSIEGGPVFAHWVRICLLRCEYIVQDAATLTAVLGDDQADPELLAEIIGVSRDAVLCVLNELSDMGLLDEKWRFRDPAVREAVLQSRGVEERSTMHAHAASVLHHHGALPTVVAEHLIAGDGLTAPWIVPVLTQAAERALAEGRPQLAVDALRTALRASTNDDEQIRGTFLLLRSQWRINPSAVVHHLPDLVVAAKAGRLNWEDSIALIAYLLWFGAADQIGELLDALERRSEEMAANGSAAGFGFVELWLGCAYPELFARLSRRGVASVDDAFHSERSALVRAAALLVNVLHDGADDEALRRAEQVLQGVRLDDRGVLAVSGALIALTYAGRLQEAAFWCDTMIAEASAQHAPTWEAVLSALRSTMDLRWGRLAEAERHAGTALRLLSVESWGAAIALPVANAILVKTAMGKYDEAEALLGIPLPDAAWQTLGGLHYLHARGRYYLATGRPHAALDDLQTCGETMTSWGIRNVTVVMWAGDAAEALLTLGDREAALNLVEREMATLAPQNLAVRASLLRVLAVTRENGERRRELLDEAAELFECVDDRFELARTYAELGRACHALGDESRGRLMERRAQRLARENGFEALYIGRSRVLAQDPSREHGDSCADALEMLSEAEQRVGMLAASGHTNRQIASKLSITVSTVEQHLTRVYRKLNVGRRADLPPELKRDTKCVGPAACD